MNDTLRTVLKITAATASLALLVGCASQARRKSNARIDEALMTAEDAQASADQAQSTADSAMSAAEQAQATADQALNAAESAQYTADQNAEKIDRVFKESM
ncbi:MAG: Lpp/OprI family alanine-zipper lipoprotein [Arhodomonas sp.]|nr:Lpp/OprI family alanine-zipper lipoprotein [Arhodomonas sp.]